MKELSRRHFLSNVGQGMLVAGMGTHLAGELGISTGWAEEEPGALTFGGLEPLVDLMQQTPVEKLQPLLLEKIKQGTELKTLISAGALANARTFAGADYIGYHTMMALMPAWQLAEELPTDRRALPVLKVLYRNTARMQSIGAKDKLRKVKQGRLPSDTSGMKALEQTFYAANLKASEETFAALVHRNAEDAYNDLQHIVHEQPDVHRVTLCWRSWDTLRLTGREHAETLLRQSVRYCLNTERSRQDRNRPEPELRSLLPKLLDEYKLLGRTTETRRGDAAWVNGLAQQIFRAERKAAAEVAASAIAEGFHHEDIHEAISLAANLLILHDAGRVEKYARPGKPPKSVHGDSPGVHAQDAANAWRNIGRVSNTRNGICSLIVGAWHAAGQKKRVKDDLFAYVDESRSLAKEDAGSLVEHLRDAVETGHQPKACAVVESWSKNNASAKPIFDVLRKYAVSEDGALHAEKYFRTVSEEFTSTRKDFRWRHLVGLARVTASEYGWAAPGRDQAYELLGIKG